jgi:hypothetical protein
MKGMVGPHSDLEEPVSNRRLVHYPPSWPQRALWSHTYLDHSSVSFPSFHKVCNNLILEKMTKGHTLAPMALPHSTAPPRGAWHHDLPPLLPPSGLFVTRACPSCLCPFMSSPAACGRRRRSRGGGGRGDSLGATPWPSIYNPWTNCITMWPGPALVALPSVSVATAGSQYPLNHLPSTPPAPQPQPPQSALS